MLRMSASNEASSERGGLVGDVVGGHELVDYLGGGGMGEVYLARHTSLGIERAIKVIRDEHRDSDEVKERFRREALALARLAHHGVEQPRFLPIGMNGRGHMVVFGLALRPKRSTNGTITAVYVAKNWRLKINGDRLTC